MAKAVFLTTVVKDQKKTFPEAPTLIQYDWKWKDWTDYSFYCFTKDFD